MMSSREFRRQIGKILKGDKTILVVRNKKPAIVVIPAHSETARRILGRRINEAYDRFVSDAKSGEQHVAEQHDKYVYENE